MCIRDRLVTASGFAAEPVATVRPKSDVPPKARKVDVVDHDFGLSMPDPYRWMEGEDTVSYTHLDVYKRQPQ